MQKIFCCFVALTAILVENCFSQAQPTVTVLYVQGSVDVCKAGQQGPCSKVTEDMDLVAAVVSRTRACRYAST